VKIRFIFQIHRSILIPSNMSIIAVTYVYYWGNLVIQLL